MAARKFLIFLVQGLCACLLLPMPGQANEPVIVRTALTPDSNIWVGQQVVLQLDILGLDGWADSKRLPEFEVDGAYLLRVESQGTRLTETISGGSYSGQRHEWLLFSQRSGTITIPATKFEVTIKQFGASTEQQIITTTTAEMEFVAAAPPGAESISGLISTTEMTATQSWEPDKTDLRAGDGIKRTIRFKAANVSGMAFTPLKAETVADLAVYPGEPEVADEINRGTLDSGQRTETFTYVPAQAGDYRIPDIRFSWWDIEQKKLHQETLEGITLTVSKARHGDNEETGVAGGREQQPNWKFVLFWTIGLILSLVLLSWLWRHQLHPGLKNYQATRQNSEPAWFRRFTRAASSGNIKTTMATLMNWLDQLALTDRPARLRQFMFDFSDDAGREQTEQFILAFNQRDDSGWNSRALLKAVTSARRNYFGQRQASDKHYTADHLQPLNP